MSVGEQSSLDTGITAPVRVKKKPSVGEKCGTATGYNLHSKHRETPCEPCRFARRERRKVLREKNMPAKGTPKKEPTKDYRCGIKGATGYNAHNRRWEIACEPCQSAALEYYRLRHPKRTRPEIIRKEPTTTSECGTDTGYFAHSKRGETSCESCKIRPLQRAQILREERALSITPPKKVRKEPTSGPSCGSKAGYNAHSKRGEVACDPCKLGQLEAGRTWRRENFDARKISKDLWRNNNKERVKEVQATWYAKNHEEERAKQAIYLDSHREESRFNVKEWRKNNNDKVEKYRHERRARTVETLSEPYSVQTILETYGTICHICNLEIDLDAPRAPGIPGWENGLHLDHVIPLAIGGTNLIENVKPSHGKCNLKKSKTIAPIENITNL